MAMGMGMRLPRSEGARGRRGGTSSAAAAATDPKNKKPLTSAAWNEGKALIWARRGRLVLGLLLMLINRLSGLVLPATSKFLIDDVIGRKRAEMLIPLAIAAGAATLVQA